MSWKTILALLLIPITIISILTAVEKYNQQRPMGLRCLSSCSSRYAVKDIVSLKECVDLCGKYQEVCR